MTCNCPISARPAKCSCAICIHTSSAHAVPGSPEPAILDLGQVVDAIMIGEGGTIQFYNMSIRNAAPRNVPDTDTHARYRIKSFGPWPSITILPNATVSRPQGSHAVKQLQIAMPSEQGQHVLLKNAESSCGLPAVSHACCLCEMCSAVR